MLFLQLVPTLAFIGAVLVIFGPVFYLTVASVFWASLFVMMLRTEIALGAKARDYATVFVVALGLAGIWPVLPIIISHGYAREVSGSRRRPRTGAYASRCRSARW